MPHSAPFFQRLTGARGWEQRRRLGLQSVGLGMAQAARAAVRGAEAHGTVTGEDGELASL